VIEPAPMPKTKPKTKPATTSGAEQPRRGRPRGETPQPSVTGIRIPAEFVEKLDAWAAEENAKKGAISRTTRSSIVLGLIKDALEAREARNKAPS